MTNIGKKKTRLMKFKRTKKNFQPNVITNSRQEMTVYERRLFALILNQIDHFSEIKQGESLTFELPIKELAKDIIPYRAIKETAHSIQRKNIFTENELKEQFSSHIVFPSIDYNKDNNGLLIIELNKHLVPYFIELGKQYISYDLDTYLSFSSVFSQRLYEIILMHILRQKPKNKPFCISITYLQSRLECNYPDFFDLKRRVLEPTKKELKTKAGLEFEYTPSKKEGKKIVELEFRVNSTVQIQKIIETLEPKQLKPVEPTLEDDYKTSLEYFYAQNIDIQNEMTRQALEQYKLTKKQKEKILLQADTKQLFIEIHLKIQVGLLNIEKPSAYIATALF